MTASGVVCSGLLALPTTLQSPPSLKLSAVFLACAPRCAKGTPLGASELCILGMTDSSGGAAPSPLPAPKALSPPSCAPAPGSSFREGGLTQPLGPQLGTPCHASLRARWQLPERLWESCPCVALALCTKTQTGCLSWGVSCIYNGGSQGSLKEGQKALVPWCVPGI